MKVQAQELIRALMENSINLDSGVTFHALQDGLLSLDDQNFSATVLGGGFMDPLLIHTRDSLALSLKGDEPFRR